MPTITQKTTSLDFIMTLFKVKNLKRKMVKCRSVYQRRLMMSAKYNRESSILLSLTKRKHSNKNKLNSHKSYSL
jgi:hypothetical protein